MWIREAKEYGNEKMKFIVVGNKLDLASSRVVTTDELKDWCENNRIEKYYEVSAKYGANITETFETHIDCI